MRQQITQLKRLQRELERRRQAQDERPRVQVIEVWCEDELLEVMPVGAKVIAVVNVDVDRV